MVWRGSDWKRIPRCSQSCSVPLQRRDTSTRTPIPIQIWEPHCKLSPMIKCKCVKARLEFPVLSNLVVSQPTILSWLYSTTFRLYALRLMYLIWLGMERVSMCNIDFRHWSRRVDLRSLEIASIAQDLPHCRFRPASKTDYNLICVFHS